MPLPRRAPGIPLGPPGTNGRRLKTDAEKEKTRLDKAEKERANNKDLARNAHSQLFRFANSAESPQVRIFLAWRLAESER